MERRDLLSSSKLLWLEQILEHVCPVLLKDIQQFKSSQGKHLDVSNNVMVFIHTLDIINIIIYQINKILIYTILYLGEISEDTGLVDFRPRSACCHEKVQQQLMKPSGCRSSEFVVMWFFLCAACLLMGGISAVMSWKVSGKSLCASAAGVEIWHLSRVWWSLIAAAIDISSRRSICCCDA